MDILILNWMDIKNPLMGGAEIILYEFSRRLIRDGHRVTWFARGFQGAKKQEVIDGIKIIRGGNKYTVYFAAYRYYVSLAIKPDKVVESINTVCWQTPLYVPKQKRIAYVNQLAKEVLLYQLTFPFSFISYLVEPLQYLTYKHTKFLCYSPSVRRDIALFGVPINNIHAFQLGIDHDRYKQGKKSVDPLFIFVARFVKMKRANLCIEAMTHVVQIQPRAKLALVGYGPEEKKMQVEIQKRGLAKNVFIVNKDNLFFEKNMKDMKVRLLQEAWALLLPSVKEGWGMVVTEAAACGTPAIVSNVTGLMDSVVHRKTGLIISPHPTALELSDAMIQIIKNTKVRKQLSDGALAWSKRFNWNNSYPSFLALLTHEKQQ